MAGGEEEQEEQTWFRRVRVKRMWVQSCSPSSPPPPFSSCSSKLEKDILLLHSLSATTVSVSEITESVVTCCVCNGKMREPIKTLSCLHSACLQCLKSYAAKSLRDDHDQEADSNCNAAITVSMKEEEEED